MIDDDPIGDEHSADDALPRKKRKYTRRAKDAGEPPAKKKRKYQKRAKAAEAEPTLVFFICEEGNVQICRADGEGETTEVKRADALRLSSFIERFRSTLEAQP